MQVLVLVTIFLSLIYPGMALMSIFGHSKKNTFLNSVWVFFWLGVSYIAVVGTNLNFGKMALHQGGYGIDWLRGWYILAMLPAILLVYRVINTKGKLFISRNVVRSILKQILSFLLIIGIAFLLNETIVLPTINAEELGYFSNHLILQKTDVFIQNNISSGLVGSGMLYSFFAGWFEPMNDNLNYLSLIFLLLTIPSLIQLLILIHKTERKRLNVLPICLLTLGVINLAIRFDLGGILAWGILIQSIMLIIYSKILDTTNKPVVDTATFRGHHLILGLSMGSLFLFDPLLSKLLIFVGLLIGIYYALENNKYSPFTNLVKIILIAILLNPIMFGFSIR